eukprot:SAG31_NODE_39_length_31377_cov_5.971482_16_plen_113_part_00
MYHTDVNVNLVPSYRYPHSMQNTAVTRVLDCTLIFDIQLFMSRDITLEGARLVNINLFVPIEGSAGNVDNYITNKGSGPVHACVCLSLYIYIALSLSLSLSLSLAVSVHHVC